MTTLMQGLIQLSGQPLVHALGWTLLHFCWQGLVVAAMLWCVLQLLGARSSQARYGAACVALALMVVLPVATFAHVASVDLQQRAAALGSGVVLDPNLVLQVGADEPIPPWPVRIGAVLDHSMPWILLGWFAGVLVFASRLNFGLLVARRLKTEGTEAVPTALQRLLDELRIRLGLQRAVDLVHSARVQVPTVIGWMRPVVLLPVSCLTGLSPDQIEAVLCHELAHVRRHDYLVSVIQSVIETVLFYHPAVWWVSRQVRRERECCCDQLAVAMGGDVLAYARALSFLEENRAAFPEFVLGANGGVLKMRIRRLLGGKGAEGSPMAALVALGMIFAAAGTCFIAVAHAQAQERAQAQAQSAQAEIAIAAEPAGMVSVSQVGTATPQGAETTGAALPDNLHGVYKSWLQQDVLWIITPEERAAFVKLTNDAERDAFINQFWARRDPPGTPAGTYREEHYARIAYSNEHFASNTQPGWRTDRGRAYIVYGKPESIDSHPTGDSTSAYPYDVWHYKYIAGIGDNVDLTFVDTCRCGQYNLTTDKPGTPGPAAGDYSARVRAVLASRQLASGGAGVPQTAAGRFSYYTNSFRAPASGQAAAAASQGTGTGTISGTIVDPNGALVPRAKVTTVNTDDGTKRIATTDNHGTFSFSLPPGPYNLEVDSPGFLRLLQENVHVKAGETVSVNLKLTVGPATQNVMVKGSAAPAAPPPPPPPPPVVLPPEQAAKAGPVRVSSGVIQGLAISQPQPVYPEDAKAKHVQGVVVLHAHIGKDGTIKDLQVISGPPALLVSAIDAVRQWKYKPFLVDGEPTEVDTTININYTLSDGGNKDMSSPPASPEGSASVSAGVMAGNLISKVMPVYPPIAKAAHVQGDVVLRALISKTGDVEDLKVVSGPPMLTASAIDAVRQWKYDPYLLNGVPVEVETTITVNFTLPDAAKSQGQAPISMAPARSAPQQYDGAPVRKIGGNVTRPTLIYKVDPEYSDEARKAKFMGVVLVSLIVDQNGVPQNVHVLRGVGMGLDQKAVEAVRQYRFMPAVENGQPVPVALNAEVNFQIFDSPKDATGNAVSLPILGKVHIAASSTDVAPKSEAGVTRPVLIHQVYPEFTEEARKAKASGVVLVHFVVDRQGRPEQVHVLRGIGHGLDGKAIEAVKQYRFTPALKDDKPVAWPLNVEVNLQVF